MYNTVSSLLSFYFFFSSVEILSTRIFFPLNIGKHSIKYTKEKKTQIKVHFSLYIKTVSNHHFFNRVSVMEKDLNLLTVSLNLRKFFANFDSTWLRLQLKEKRK